MRHTTKKLLALSLLSLGLVTSCKKKDSSSLSSTSCTSTIYGYSVPIASITDSLTTCTSGIINTSSAVISSAGSFSCSGYLNQGAYNGGDNCYYAFKILMAGEYSLSPLYKITSTGVVTALTTSGSDRYCDLVYNKVTNKLYCNKNGNLVEISITGSTFTTTTIATPVHPIYYFRNSLTVDNNTGNMYFVTGDTTNYFIEKYAIGATSTTVVASHHAWSILGMRYNESDNMLYAVQNNSTTSAHYDIIKIDPSAGTTSTVAALTSSFNEDFHSTCIDPCANRFIISTLANLTTPVLNQFNTSGTLVQSDTTASCFQGLDAWHASL